MKMISTLKLKKLLTSDFANTPLVTIAILALAITTRHFQRENHAVVSRAKKVKRENH